MELRPELNYPKNISEIQARRRNELKQIGKSHKYDLFAEDTTKKSTIRKQAFWGTLDNTLLNQVFMSQENQDLIQDVIKYQVWVKTNKQHIIDRQSDTDLQIIMRSIYFQYGKNQKDNISYQIKELDNLVVQECVPKIISGLVQYLGYLYDASVEKMPLSLPAYEGTKGRKTLPSVTSTF